MKIISSLTIYLITISAFLALIVSSSSVIYDCGYFHNSECNDGDTNNAMRNYASCPFSSCGGNEIVISNYQNCVGNTFLRLYDSEGYELSYQDNVYWVSTTTLYTNLCFFIFIIFIICISDDCCCFE